MKRAIIYLLGILVAETVIVALTNLNPNFMTFGIGLYCLLFAVMIIDAARMNRFFQGKLVLSLALVPLIRIFSMVFPLMQVPQIWWYPIIYFPLLIAAIVVAYILEYKPAEIGISLRSWPLQLGVASLGLALGYVEFIILSPQPLVSSLTWANAWLPAVLLFVSTGAVEELIFRGVMQKSAMDIFGGKGILYVSLIFAVLHMGWAVGPEASSIAWLDLLFVLAVAMLFGWIVKKTGSLLGVTLCHGTINVVLFIIGPLLFTA